MSIRFPTMNLGGLVPRRRGTIALVVGVAIIVVLAVMSAYDAAGLHHAFVTLRKLRLSKEATGNIKDALTSAAGAILASTAIGISLATFFIQQNVEHIPYRAVVLISRQDRVIVYLVVTVALAIGAYYLAAIVIPQNALAVAIGGIVIVLAFTYVIAWFFLENMRLLDPVNTIDVLSRDRRKKLRKQSGAFSRVLDGIRREAAGLANHEIVRVGHAHEDDAINASRALRDIADGFVEEVIPQIRVLARQGDYRAARDGCKEIAEVCVAALSATDDIYTQFRQAVLIRFADRPSFLNTFGRLLALAEQARAARDPNLYAVIVRAHLSMSRELMPLANAAGEHGDASNCVYAILQFSRFASTSYNLDLVDVPNSCINAITELTDAWTAGFTTFPYLLRSEVKQIVQNSLSLHSGDLAADRGLKCLIALIHRAMTLGVQQLSQIRQTLDTMSAIIRMFADKYAPGKGGQLEFPSVLDTVVGDYTVRANELSLFSIVHNVIPPWRPLAQADKWDDLAVWVPFTMGCLELWRSAGEVLATTSVAQQYTSDIAQRILATIAVCVELRSVLPADMAEIKTLDDLVDQQLTAFPANMSRFALDDFFHFLIWTALADIAVAAASAARLGVCRLVVRVCLDMAELCMAPARASRPEEPGAYIYVAIILAALDDTDASVALIVDRLRANLWASFVQRNPQAMPIFTGLMQRSDVQSFEAQYPETSLFTIHTASQKKLVEQAGMPRIAAVQQRVLAALQSIGQ